MTTETTITIKGEVFSDQNTFDRVIDAIHAAIAERDTALLSIAVDRPPGPPDYFEFMDERAARRFGGGKNGASPQAAR